MDTPLPQVQETEPGATQRPRNKHLEALLDSQMALACLIALGGLLAGGFLLAIVVKRDLGIFSLTGAVGMLLAVIGLAGIRLAVGAARISRAAR